MELVTCPFCNSIQSKPVRKWKDEPSTEVYRYRCRCHKIFDYYKNLEKTWTNPSQIDTPNGRKVKYVNIDSKLKKKIPNKDKS